ncbi:MAG TPA: glycine--tRNA ligase subunit beta [Thiobacillus sp.]|nr:MAG: glycine--tRNA ligase subunit beta [Hydrogenophilales bacterium 16-64-40]OZA34991.1 MAG: glycine--tRNA ligase subunit beta [Hydrogenophilales bacterium 17-64-65]HQS80893.1 glycine--tRNA ligase subunit beta [Thiobacillus sp.]HQT33491.1 glycine--tRNA ligase subunit beta [Thiobacillus sp.]
MTAANLLIELFVEELPPKALKKLGEAFAAALAESLVAQGLADSNATVTGFASPRRLGVHVQSVLARAADKPVSTKLMPVAVGLDADGKATPALLKRLAALGADASVVGQLRRAADGKNEALFHDSIAPGTTLADGLQHALETAMAKLPIPKVMQYQLADGWSSVNFVRPVHGVVALHGADIVPVSVLGLQAGRDTQGHRFEARVSPVVIQSADSYAAQLKDEGAVTASFAERRAEIVRQLQAAAAPSGLKPIEDDALLDEVTALVERPNVLVGQFEQAFLEVPQECLILTMKANQKYFPLLDAAGKLTNRFLIVSNISPADASAVIGGNERVVRPRLADAKFFFDQDRKKTLGSRVPGLSKVVYHNKLGSQGDRVERVRAIARWVAEKVGAGVGLADRAAELAKADLLTDMVGEFPELQGIMGGYYARHNGEDEQVAQAIADQYLVRREETEDVSNLISEVLQIADRMETLVGIWGIGLRPTGDKDPFALRRHALSVIKSFQLLGLKSALDEAALRLDLDDLIAFSLSVFPAGMLGGNVAEELKLFIYERNANQLTPVFGAEAVAAVFSNLPPLHDVAKRLRAVQEFASLPESPSLAAANKRVGNILKKAEGEVGGAADPARFVEVEEKALFAALSGIAPRADAAFAAGDYTASLQALAALKAPVDAFFDQVMVNADDPALKANRLALLNQLHQTMNRVADLSRLAA